MADANPDLPEVLFELKLHAPHIPKSGEKEVITLVKRPPLDIEDPEVAKTLIATWNAWWNETAWAKDSGACKPRWNSASRTGEVWTQFWESAHALTGRPYVYCHNCGFALQHPSVKSIGTKHLINHLRTRACRDTHSPVHKRSPTTSPQQKAKPIFNFTYSLEAFDDELVRVVIDNNWAFRTVERPSFQRFLRFLQPNTPTINRPNFRRIFLDKYNVAKAATLHDLSKATKISIALDAWSAANHLSFLAINGYYINDDWQLKETLLDFLPMRGSHTGESMAIEVLHVLRNTNTTRRLLAITCDNASNNTTLTQSIQRKLSEDNITWSSQENTIPCLAHVINLVVQDIIHHLRLSAYIEVEDGETLQRRHVNDVQTQISVPNSLRKLRAICIAIDRSPQRFERFIATQRDVPAKERLSVIRDVKTRWNSTHDMCERAVKLQLYIDDWLEQEIALKMTTRANNASTSSDTVEADFKDLKKLRLAAIEWQHLKAITHMLRKFKDATNFLSKNQQPQLPYIWLMYNRLFDFLDEMTEDLGDESNAVEHTGWPDVVKAAADKGRLKLSKYYSRTGAEQGFLFNCATILDPSQKLTAYEDETWEAQDKHMYRQQFLSYLDRYDDTRARSFTPASGSQPKRSLGSEWFRKPPSLSTSQSSTLSASSQGSNVIDIDNDGGPTRQEGESYLSTPRVISGDNFDVLGWWKDNESTYPQLAQVAKDILAAPIAQVGVERIFNISKDVIGDRRHHLSAQTIRQIMILKYWISGGQPVSLSDPCADNNLAPCDEIDDLFELPAGVQQLEETGSFGDTETVYEEPITPSHQDQRPRKRMKPLRYREETL